MATGKKLPTRTKVPTETRMERILVRAKKLDGFGANVALHLTYRPSWGICWVPPWNWALVGRTSTWAWGTTMSRGLTELEKELTKLEALSKGI